jgi:mRNA interferase MazF
MFVPSDVLLVDYPGVQGLKVRPAIVVSTAHYQSTRPDLVLAMCSTQIRKANASTDYFLQDWASAGLHLPSSYRSFFTTLPATKVIHYIGTLTQRDWLEVQARLRLSLAVA